ncbi:hypothetical protein IKQ21_08295 [bacterium]|nr:hypothetical protein [bacterium]
MFEISQISFQGKFKYDKLKSKQARKLREILTTEFNGISAERLLKPIPLASLHVIIKISIIY